jgi:hypothetical protein
MNNMVCFFFDFIIAHQMPAEPPSGRSRRLSLKTRPPAAYGAIPGRSRGIAIRGIQIKSLTNAHTFYLTAVSILPFSIFVKILPAEMGEELLWMIAVAV